MPLRDLQGWMGHESCQTTEIYVAFTPDKSQGRTCAELAFGGAAACPVAGRAVDSAVRRSGA